MASVPLERILCPVPVVAFSAVTEVLSCVEVHLAGPILQQVLKADYQVDLRVKDVENVIWKVKQYVPCLARASANLGHLPFTLKRYQELCPEAATVSLPHRQKPCPCGNAVVPKSASALRSFVGALESLVDKAWSLRAYALNAEHTAAQVQARLLELLILAMMGFVIMGSGRYCLAAYADDDLDFLECCNRLG